MSSNKVITEPSICIPRTLNNVTWYEVKDIMEELFGKGTIERVDMVQDKRDTQFCRIFIHLRHWPMSDPRIVAMRENLLAGREVKVVHNQPWFWKCVASNSPRPENKRTTPYLVMEEPSSTLEDKPSSTLEDEPPSTLEDKPSSTLEDEPPSMPEVVRQNGFGASQIAETHDACEEESVHYKPSKRAVAKKALDRSLKSL
jgi:hypothetical protein